MRARRGGGVDELQLGSLSRPGRFRPARTAWITVASVRGRVNERRRKVEPARARASEVREAREREERLVVRAWTGYVLQGRAQDEWRRAVVVDEGRARRCSSARRARGTVERSRAEARRACEPSPRGHLFARSPPPHSPELSGTPAESPSAPPATTSTHPAPAPSRRSPSRGPPFARPPDPEDPSPTARAPRLALDGVVLRDPQELGHPGASAGPLSHAPDASDGPLIMC